MYERRRLMLCSKKVISPLYIYEPGYKDWKNVLEVSKTGSGCNKTDYSTHRVLKPVSMQMPTASILLKVDFTYYKKLSITAVSNGLSKGSFVGYSLNGTTFVEKAKLPIGKGEAVNEFDISKCKGEYYIKLEPESNSFYMVLYEIKLEV